MRAQIQAQIDALNKLADLLHHKCENLIAADAEGIAANLEAAIRPQWVPVTERLPDTPRSVFVIDQNEDGYSIGYYLGGYGWGGCDIDDENVTHWHEIEYPEPPEVQAQ